MKSHIANILVSVAIGTAMLFVPLLLAFFTLWSVDMAKWEWSTRWLVAIFGILFGGGGGAIAWTLLDFKRKYPHD